jgi:hypothetical protein
MLPMSISLANEKSLTRSSLQPAAATWTRLLRCLTQTSCSGPTAVAYLQAH